MIETMTDDWSKLMRDWQQSAGVEHKRDMVVIWTNARINRMSNRRQKIALSKRPRTVLTNCYPISVGEMTNTTDNLHTLDVTFKYDNWSQK